MNLLLLVSTSRMCLDNKVATWRYYKFTSFRKCSFAWAAASDFLPYVRGTQARLLVTVPFVVS